MNNQHSNDPNAQDGQIQPQPESEPRKVEVTEEFLMEIIKMVKYQAPPTTAQAIENVLMKVGLVAGLGWLIAILLHEGEIMLFVAVLSYILSTVYNRYFKS